MATIEEDKAKIMNELRTGVEETDEKLNEWYWTEIDKTLVTKVETADNIDETKYYYYSYFIDGSHFGKFPAYKIERRNGIGGFGKKEVKDKIKDILDETAKTLKTGNKYDKREVKGVLQVLKSDADAPADAPAADPAAAPAAAPADAPTGDATPAATGGRRSRRSKNQRKSRRSRKQRNERKSRKQRRSRR